MQVVCDTNIWYSIGAGKINPRSLETSTELICTYVSLHEIAYSHKLHRSPLEVKRAAQAILDYKSLFEFLNPFSYITSLERRSTREEFAVGEYLFEEVLRFAQVADHELEEKARLSGERIRIRIEDARTPLQTGTDFINNELLPDVRETIRRSSSKKQHRQRDNSTEQQAVIGQWVQMATGYKLSTYFDWSPLEFMMGVSSQFNLELELSQVMKLHENDWHDFLNMAYVTPDRLYWTQEKKWKRYAREAGLSHYLFEY